MCNADKMLIFYDESSSRSQLLLGAFEILNIYCASTFAIRPYQALSLVYLVFLNVWRVERFTSYQHGTQFYISYINVSFFCISHMFRSMKAEPFISFQMYQQFNISIFWNVFRAHMVSGVGGETDHNSCRLRTELHCN